MITCPECGQQAADDAKYCDRCGQGLVRDVAHVRPASLPALEPATELKGEYRIVALIGQTAIENRYRAERSRTDAGERVQLREQAKPAAAFSDEPIPNDAQLPVPAEDPAGPRAKTAELQLKRTPSEQLAPNGSAATRDTPSGTASEGEQRPEMDQSTEVREKLGDQESESGSGDHQSDSSGSVEAESEEVVEVATEATSGDAAARGRTSDGEEVAEENAAEHQATEGNAPEIDVPANGRPNENQATGSRRIDDLGEVFGRVLALSMTLNHPAFARATDGFADRDRVYLVYPDEELSPLSSRHDAGAMDEAEALDLAIQVCQAVGFAHRRGLRVNDICPESVAYGAGRIKMTGLDYISNDTELQSEPIFNDGYTAPEIYRGKKVDKRADVFSIGALLYTCLTGERIDSETWREEAGPIRFYPPHVITPALEQVVRRALLFDPAARWPTVEAFKAELVELASKVRIRSEALTDVGMVREHNEDAVLTFECKRDSLVDPSQTLLYVVADGMGGAEAGEVASAIAVGAIRNYVEDKLTTAGAGEVRAIVQQALEHANSRILEYQAAHPEARNMGSTAVAALITQADAAIAWVGDSRAYLRDGNGLRQVTKDHSLVQRLVEIGQISADEARHHEHKNVITRSLGARATGAAGAESIALRLRRGDRLMLCSDGLTAHVEDRQIDELLRRHSEPGTAARELVVAANAGGGTDNVSVVVIVAG